tara:strand:+ start:401 stop:574 length:174 start_codon:yes stop_codon:yes gene_type:complete
MGRHGATAPHSPPLEPLYVMIELKFSPGMGFGTPDPAAFPFHFEVDYVRLYQVRHSK